MEVRERRNHKDIGEVMGKGGETEDAVDHGRGRGARMRMRGTLDGPRVTSGRQVERSRPSKRGRTVWAAAAKAPPKAP